VLKQAFSFMVQVKFCLVLHGTSKNNWMLHLRGSVSDEGG